MSTLAEIESAVDGLPRPEQVTLLEYLRRRLAGAAPGSAASAVDAQRRQLWLAELRQLRERNATGGTGAPLQQVMDEIRDEFANRESESIRLSEEWKRDTSFHSGI